MERKFSLGKKFIGEGTGYFDEHARSILQGNIESGISQSIANNKDMKVEKEAENSSSINIVRKGKQVAQIVFGQKEVLVKNISSIEEQKFQYKDKESILDALKNITK